MLPDGGRAGACAGGEEVEGLVGSDQRSLGGEWGGGEAYDQDAFRLRQRERFALRAGGRVAAPPAHTRDRGGPAANRGGAGGHVRAAPSAHLSRRVRDDLRSTGGPRGSSGGRRRSRMVCGRLRRLGVRRGQG